GRLAAEAAREDRRQRRIDERTERGDGGGAHRRRRGGVVDDRLGDAENDRAPVGGPGGGGVRQHREPEGLLGVVGDRAQALELVGDRAARRWAQRLGAQLLDGDGAQRRVEGAAAEQRQRRGLFAGVRRGEGIGEEVVDG